MGHICFSTLDWPYECQLLLYNLPDMLLQSEKSTTIEPQLSILS